MSAKHIKSATCALVVMTSAFFACSVSMAKPFKSLTIYQRLQLNDVILEPGEYKVEIESDSGTTKVAFYKGKKLVVTARAQTIQQESKVQRSSVLYLLNGEDAPYLTQLRLAGERVSYQFSSTGQATKKKVSKNT